MGKRLSKAHYNGKTHRNSFAQYSVNQNIKDRTYLTEDKIKTVMTHELAGSKLAYTHDLFVFASFTTLSFVDINQFYCGCERRKWILSNRYKKKVSFQVKLLDITMQIIK